MFDKVNLEVELIEKFVNLIAQYTGLKIRKSEISLLTQNIILRVKALRLSSAEDYYRLLNRDDNNEEWMTLIGNLTNTESYFFRDKGQFSLLKNKIIPNIIKNNIETRNIRIWSAGCSSGEEVYSLAILLQEIISDLYLWNVHIFGTDINHKALTKAKKGVYTTWSFRMVDSEIREKNFKPINNQYQIKSEVQKIVNFSSLNLVKDKFPQENSLIRDMDLIICRNVFIYFEPLAVAEVLNKFYETLKPNGYLLTGHAELSGQDLSKYQTHVFPESLIYEKTQVKPIVNLPLIPFSFPVQQTNLSPNSLPLINNFSPKTVSSQQEIFNTLQTQSNNLNNFIIKNQEQTRISQDENLLTQAETFFKQKQYNLAIEKVKEYLKKHSQSFKAYYIIAKIYANIGQYQEAINNCKQALKINELAVQPYYLLAKISEEQGNLTESKQLFKKIIYLDANFVPGYLDLAQIYQQEGDVKRATKMRETALQLLTKLSPKHEIEEIEYVTVSELIEQLKKDIS